METDAAGVGLSQASLMLTDRLICGLKPRLRQFEVFDSKVPGLTIRISPQGSKSFSVLYRIGGRNRRLTLGRYPIVTLADARKRARQVLNQVWQGLDPATEKIRQRADYEGSLFPAALDEFVETHAKRKTRGARETERLLRREFGKPWAKLQVQQITRRHINDLLDGIVNRGTPSAANHAFAAIRRLLNWAVERGYLVHSPCQGVKAPSKVGSRHRVLSEAELTRIWLAAELIGYPFGRLVQLLLLTAQRRSEVAGMRWSELDLSKAYWHLPPGNEDRKHKSSHPHTIPLGSRIIEILASLPRVHEELVFPARGKDNPVSGYSKWKQKLDNVSGVRAWTLHDLRRTAATQMASLGVASPCGRENSEPYDGNVGRRSRNL